MYSIDIIVPSYRLESKYILSIINMQKPDNVRIRYFIIGDNPNEPIPTEIEKVIDNQSIFIFKNKKNLGAHGSRNVGLENADADWILFIDDDVEPRNSLLLSYVKAIDEKPNEIGFFGETLFPKSFNSFTKGIIACDILTFFFIAGYYDKLKWAPTSNVIIRRSVIGDTKFQSIFPNNGGGEDIDFFLQINKKTGKELQCLQDAAVYHNWWYKGKRNYTRFTRWSFGDSLLHKIYPEFTYYNFPNVIESLFLSLIFGGAFAILSQTILPVFSLLFGVILGEVIIEFGRLFLYKGFSQSIFAIETALIRASNDIGRLYMQLIKLKRVQGICERFDHFCDGKHIKYQRIWAGIKFITYISISLLIYQILK